MDHLLKTRKKTKNLKNKSPGANTSGGAIMLKQQLGK